MDPLTIASAVSSIVFTLVKTGRQLHTIFEAYKDAQHSLFMIQTECTVLAAALSQIQIHFSGQSKRIKELPQNIFDALELSLMGCGMTLSILTDEVGKLVGEIEISQTLKRSHRAKYIWKEATMSSLMQQLRGQSLALSLLLKAMDG